MISVCVKTSTGRNTVNVDVNTTPSQVFNNLGVSPAGAMVNLNGTILSAVDQQATFAQLGVTDGTSVNLNAVVKADGANK